MDEIRTRGTDKELVDEIVRLSKEHMIVTPYTAYLILEDTPPGAAPAAMRFRESAKRGFTGRDEWHRARNQASWRGAHNAELQNRAASEAIGQNAADRARRINGRNFVLRKAGWVEDGFRPETPVDEIKFLSEEYMELLRSDPDAAQYLANGRTVTFKQQDRWVAVK
ncbi:MAG: hypothetical protein ACYTAF_02495 [Planctomycetota bacterium]|jgi:Ca-activated chloride channel family protein